MAHTTISPREAAEKLQREPSARLIDVRTEAEFDEVHAKPAVNVPLHAVSADRVRSLWPSGEPGPVLLVCKTGSRSRQAADTLAKQGLEQLTIVDGGTEAWVASDLPAVRGRKTISLERQVRIAAGSLVALGTAAALVTPWALIVPAFVGCGLVFAGVTDTCGMAMMLSRMPWNRRPTARAQPATA